MFKENPVATVSEIVRIPESSSHFSNLNVLFTQIHSKSHFFFHLQTASLSHIRNSEKMSSLLFLQCDSSTEDCDPSSIRAIVLCFFLACIITMVLVCCICGWLFWRDINSNSITRNSTTGINYVTKYELNMWCTQSRTSTNWTIEKWESSTSCAYVHEHRTH